MTIQMTEQIHSSSLEELVVNITTISTGLAAKVEMLKEYSYNPYQNELCELLTRDTINRFLGIVSTLDVPHTFFNQKLEDSLFEENNVRINLKKV